MGEHQQASTQLALIQIQCSTVCFSTVFSALIHSHCNIKTSFHMLHLLTVINFSLSPHTHTHSFYLTSKSQKKVHSHKNMGQLPEVAFLLSKENLIGASAKSQRLSHPLLFTLHPFPSSGLLLLPGLPLHRKRFLIKHFLLDERGITA